MQRRGRLLASLVAVLLLGGSLALAGRWLQDGAVDPPQSADRLDLSKYALTFSEEFDDLSVSAAGPGTRWTAHTPYGGDFGDARFTDPSPGFPFTIGNGMLRIEARKGADGKWRSGLLSSRDPRGRGFAQQFGYFEMRAKLPDGPGVWPAFWLLGIDRSDRFPEIDVLEYYGHATHRFHSVVHVWSKGGGKSLVSRQQITRVAPRALVEDFNTYGVEVKADWTTFYLNGAQIWRTKSEPEFSQPMYILLNLAMGSGWPIDKTPNPSFMFVDYVRAYALE
jgi:beta-glucanase (GH16 family)